MSDQKQTRHTAYDLKQMQSLPLAAKVSMTKRRIRDWYDGWQGQVYLAFSGGKDSTVLKHIIDEMYYDVPSVFVNTGLEFPEIQRFAKSQKNVTVIRPKMRFDEVIKKYGYPIISKAVADKLYEARTAYERGKTGTTAQAFFDGSKKGSQFNYERHAYLLKAPFKVAGTCCAKIKKHPARDYAKETGRKVILATLAEESRLRKTLWMEKGCNAWESVFPTSTPMAFWTEQDVLMYIVQNHLPICSVYGEVRHKQMTGNIDGQIDLIDSIGYEDGDLLETTGCYRTGCIFCGFGCHLEKEPNRFQRLKETHPRQWEYCIKGGEWKDGLWQPSKDGLGMGFVLDYIGVKYE